MKKILIALVLVTAFGAHPGKISLVPAAAAEEDAGSSRVRRTQTMRPEIYKKLEEARDVADNGDTAGALELLQKLESRKRNSYETAMTHSIYAYVYSMAERYDDATREYETILGIAQAPDSLRQTTRFTLAQLYMMQEKYSDALKTLNTWMESSEKAGADSYVLRAQIEYQMEAFPASLKDIQTALNLRRQAGSVPQENWLLLERAALFQMKDYKGLAQNLEALVANYPKSEYWVQLAAVYNELGAPKKELATLETAYDQKMLTKENELINYAQALLGMDIPYKAGQVLSKGMKDGVVEESARNLSLLGDGWMLAKEYDSAIVAMTKAAQESGKGLDYFKLAQIYTQRQEWTQALDFADKALDSGDLKLPSQALIIKGLAQFNLDRLESAAATFFQAGRYPEAEKTAHQWQDFIESEQQRREYIAAASDN